MTSKDTHTVIKGIFSITSVYYICLVLPSHVMFEFIFKTQQFSTFVKNFNPLEPDFVFMGYRKATPGSNELMYNLILFSDLPLRRILSHCAKLGTKITLKIMLFQELTAIENLIKWSFYFNGLFFEIFFSNMTHVCRYAVIYHSISAYMCHI